MNQIDVRSRHLKGAEIAWFAPICNGDDEYLGAHDPSYRSNWKNASDILLRADRLGFQNILCPSSYQVGQDTWTFASAVAPLTQQISLLPAVRCGEQHPPMLARSIATLDHILTGRLTINIISSDLPGHQLPSQDRYQRSREVIEILKQAWTQPEINFQGQFYQLHLDTEPIKPYQQNGGPLLYFGGYSPAGIELCAEHCDVYLMWPETEERLAELMQTMSHRAQQHGRQVDFGLRVHMIVRETEREARMAAKKLMSKIDLLRGNEIRNRAQDAASLGVARQTMVRQQADLEGFVEDGLWTGIGKARSGCGAALVGDPDQIVAKMKRYHAMGIRAFILSGYPHFAESELVAKYVLPAFSPERLSKSQNRIPSETPSTPLGCGLRK